MTFLFIFLYHFQCGVVVGGVNSISAVCMYVHPVRNTNGFRSISFEKISVLDSNFIHRYIIIKCRSSSF